MNFDRLRFVSERAEIGEQREAVFAVTIPEERGSFRRFCEAVGPRNVTEFNYRIADASKAHVFVGIQIQRRAEAAQIADDLRGAGFDTLDLSERNRALLAWPKPGTRYIIGCHAQRMLQWSHKPHVWCVKNAPGRGIAESSDMIRTGNSAFGALQVAIHLGATKIGLIGVDANNEPHWHGDTRSKSLAGLPAMFSCAVPQLQKKGIEVRLGTIYDKPNVTCFKSQTPEELLEWLA
jgi:hypothetical protein